MLEARSETSAPSSTLRVPRLYPDLPRSLFTVRPAPFPLPLLPLQEVAGAEGIVRVHGPFSLIDLSQIEKRFGSFSDPDNYLKEVKYLTQSYNLTRHDIYIVLPSTLLPEEKEQVWQASQAHADEIRRIDDTKPIGATVIPLEDPNWDYQAGRPG